MRVETEVSPAPPDTGAAVSEPAPLLPEFLTEHTGCIVAKIGQAVVRLIDSELEALGLRIRHYQVLKTLAEGSATSQQAVGSLLRIDGATMVATIDDLEALGYVSRRRNTKDRRAYAILLTPAGRAALAEAERAIDAVDRRVLQDLSSAEARQLHLGLTRLVHGDGLRREVDDLRARGK